MQVGGVADADGRIGFVAGEEEYDAVALDDALESKLAFINADGDAFFRGEEGTVHHEHIAGIDAFVYHRVANYLDEVGRGRMRHEFLVEVYRLTLVSLLHGRGKTGMHLCALNELHEGAGILGDGEDFYFALWHIFRGFNGRSSVFLDKFLVRTVYHNCATARTHIRNEALDDDRTFVDIRIFLILGENQFHNIVLLRTLKACQSLDL